MKDHDELWERIDELLDERRDPFEDPEVNGALLEDPAALEQVTRLRAALIAIERGPRPLPLWRTIGMPVAASVLGLLLLGDFASRGSAPPREKLTSPETTAQSTTPAGIQRFQMNVVTENGARRITTHFDGETYSRRIDLLSLPGNDDASRLTDTTFSTSSSRRLPR